MASDTKFDFGKPPETLVYAAAIIKRHPYFKAASAAEADHELSLFEWAKREVVTEELRRLLVLADHYGILRPKGLGLLPWGETESAAHLARSIAADFIDNFSPLSKGRGNPRNALASNFELFLFIRNELKNGKVTLSQAIGKARKKGSPGHGKTSKQIENAYHRAAKKLAEENINVALAIVYERLAIPVGATFNAG
jgi:hypothetical protein